MSKPRDHENPGQHPHDHGGHDDCACGTAYDPRYFGFYGGKDPPRYEPHCLEHSCFRVVTAAGVHRGLRGRMTETCQMEIPCNMKDTEVST